MESLSTIRFGVRAKSIENKVTVNQSRSPEELGERENIDVNIAVCLPASFYFSPFD